MAKIIPLTLGKFAIVDNEDYEMLKAMGSWYAEVWNGGAYAIKNLPWKDGKRPRARMHRVIMNAPKGIEVDHINGNGLDNRKVNLRLCSRTENNRNQRKTRGWSSKFKGVRPKTGRVGITKWHSQITVNHKSIYLGSFENEIKAGIAYNDAARQHFGEFAKLNEI